MIWYLNHFYRLLFHAVEKASWDVDSSCCDLVTVYKFSNMEKGQSEEKNLCKLKII